MEVGGRGHASTVGLRALGGKRRDAAKLCDAALARPPCLLARSSSTHHLLCFSIARSRSLAPNLPVDLQVCSLPYLVSTSG